MRLGFLFEFMPEIEAEAETDVQNAEEGYDDAESEEKNPSSAQEIAAVLEGSYMHDSLNAIWHIKPSSSGIDSESGSENCPRPGDWAVYLAASQTSKVA